MLWAATRGNRPDAMPYIHVALFMVFVPAILKDVHTVTKIIPSTLISNHTHSYSAHLQQLHFHYKWSQQLHFFAVVDTVEVLLKAGWDKYIHEVWVAIAPDLEKEVVPCPDHTSLPSLVPRPHLSPCRERLGREVWSGHETKKEVRDATDCGCTVTCPKSGFQHGISLP